LSYNLHVPFCHYCKWWSTFQESVAGLNDHISRARQEWEPFPSSSSAEYRNQDLGHEAELTNGQCLAQEATALPTPTELRLPPVINIKNSPQRRTIRGSFEPNSCQRLMEVVFVTVVPRSARLADQTVVSMVETRSRRRVLHDPVVPWTNSRLEDRGRGMFAEQPFCPLENA
jgi:hypothetical protein